MPVSIAEWMFKNSLACIQTFVESLDETQVICNIGDIYIYIGTMNQRVHWFIDGTNEPKSAQQAKQEA